MSRNSLETSTGTYSRRERFLSTLTDKLAHRYRGIHQFLGTKVPETGPFGESPAPECLVPTSGFIEQAGAPGVVRKWSAIGTVRDGRAPARR